MILKKSPGGTIIPGGTFIRESRVAQYNEKIAAKMLKTIKVKKQSLYKKGKI